MTKPSKTLTSAQLALLTYANAGFRVFPVSGKVPIVKQWQKTEYVKTPKLERFTLNFGVALDSTHIIVDVDPRNFALNDPHNPELGRVNSFDRLCADLGVDLAAACGFIVRTGSGGQHFYFTKKSDFLIRGGLRPYPGVEFKTAGQYVVGYGSIHPETKAEYTVISGSPDKVTDAPSILLAAIERKAYDFASGMVKLEFQDDDLTKKRYQEYLLNAPAAIEGEGGDKQTYIAACEGRDLGLHPNTAFDLMCKFYNPRCEPPWELDEIMVKIRNAYRYAQNDQGVRHPKADFLPLVIKKENIHPHFNADGVTLKRDLHNTCNWLVGEGNPLVGLFGFNEVTHRIEFMRIAPWNKTKDKIDAIDDTDILMMKMFMSQHGPFEPSTILLREAVEVIANLQKFNPIKDYLKSLKWDGINRLDSWLVKYAGADDNLYTRSVSQKVPIAMIARIFNPGTKFDTMCILEGAQGLKKSMLWKELAGGYYAAKSLNTQDKDFIVTAMTKWIVEIADMATHKHSDVEHIKAFLSTDEDNLRLPYGHYSRPIPRQFIIVGTKNFDEDRVVGYLSDGTGNRRYWIIPVRGVKGADGLARIDIEGFREVRDQLFAEAMVLYNNGVKVYFDDVATTALASELQKSRMGRDPWADRITEWALRNDIIKRPVVTSIDVYCECLGGTAHQCNVIDQKRIAAILRDLHFKHGTYWHPGLKATIRGYRPPTPSEIQDVMMDIGPSPELEGMTIGDL